MHKLLKDTHKTMNNALNIANHMIALNSSDKHAYGVTKHVSKIIKVNPFKRIFIMPYIGINTLFSPSKEYRGHKVDVEIDDYTLNLLNSNPNVQIESTCIGHEGYLPHVAFQYTGKRSPQSLVKVLKSSIPEAVIRTEKSPHDSGRQFIIEAKTKRTSWLNDIAQILSKI